MSLGVEWFSKEARQQRERAYPDYSASDWDGALIEYLGVWGPIADEAAKWLGSNKTPEQIHKDFGFSVLRLYVVVSGDKEAELLIKQLPKEEAEYQEGLMRAREEALRTREEALRSQEVTLRAREVDRGTREKALQAREAAWRSDCPSH